MEETPTADVRIHPKFAPLYPHLEPKRKRYYVYHGGRCGLKSWGFAQAGILRSLDDPLKFLCAREIQKSMRESVHALLKDSIARLDVRSNFEIQNDRIINVNNGGVFNFVGLHNNTVNLKSYEGTHICWIEEAQSVTEKSWDDLDPTIRWELKDEKGRTLRGENGDALKAAEMWISFNPEDELDPTYVRFVANPRPNSLVIKTSWRDALLYDWFPKDLQTQMLQMKRENYKKYLHVWEGEPNSNYEDAIIQPEWFEAAIDAHIKKNWEVTGARIASFDPADTGDDRAACCRHGYLIKYLDAWGNKELPESIQEAYFRASQNDCERLVYDADGLGAAMKVNLEKNETEYRLQADPFHGGMGPDEPDAPYPPYNAGTAPDGGRIKLNKDTFRNKRAQYYWYLRDRLENTYNAVTKNQWIDPDRCISISSEIPKATLQQLRRELTRIRRKKGENSSKITLESKADMKKMGIKSPNLSDALMMVFANQPEFGQSGAQMEIETDWE